MRVSRRSVIVGLDVATNLAYPLALVAVLGTPIAGAADLLYLLLLSELAVASGYYHAGGKAGNHWDVGAMYAVGIYLWLAGAIGISPVLALMIALPSAYWLRMRQLDVPMEFKIGALFGVLYLTAITFHPDAWRTIALAGIVLVVALLIRPKLHSLWHLLSAVGLALLWAGVR